MGKALGRVPSWAWLAAIVAGSTIVRAILARDLVAPFIMVDEIIWSEVARGIADAGEPLLRDQPDPGYSLVYPLLISPVYALFESLPDAYAGVKTVNALLMSLAAVPAFFLARRVVRDGLALLAALMSVAIPSMAYTGTVMTENAFYPLFLLAVLLLVVVLERPTPVRVAALLLLVGLAYATRVQAVALVPAILVAPLVLALFERSSFRATLAKFRWLYGIVAAGALAVFVIRAALGGALLGAYEPVGERSYDLGEALRYPVVARGRALALPARDPARGDDRPRRAGALARCAAPGVSRRHGLHDGVRRLGRGHVRLRVSDRIQERNMFYVAPLLCIGLLAWVERGAPRPRLLAGAAAVVSALLVVAIPLERFITTSALTDTLMLLPFWSLQDRIGPGWTEAATFGLAAALAAAFLFVPRRYALTLPLLVLCIWILAIRPIWWGTHGFERFSRGALFQGIRTVDRDWVDQALPSGADTAFLWTGRTDRLTVNQNEFFNRGVGPVYYVTAPTPGGLPESEVRIDPRTGEVTFADGTPVRDRFLLADSSFEPDGEALAADEGWGITLWRVQPPLVSAVRVDGLYPNDTWSGETVTYTRRRCRPGTLTALLSSDPSLFVEPQTVVAHSNGRVVGRAEVGPYGRAHLRVPLAPAPGTTDCRVVYTVEPTAVPADVTGGANPDPRELGAHFDRFFYESAP